MTGNRVNSLKYSHGGDIRFRFSALLKKEKTSSTEAGIVIFLLNS
jgi:hypothetical protein